LILDGVLNFFLIQKYGINGGAITTLSIGIVGTILFSCIVFLKFRFLLNLKSFIKIVIAGVVIVGIYKILDFVMIIDKYSMIPIFVLILLTYYAILVLLKEISKNEITYLKRIMIR
jgi:O-antigen/teichoic acid export membrane protein